MLATLALPGNKAVKGSPVTSRIYGKDKVFFMVESYHVASKIAHRTQHVLTRLRVTTEYVSGTLVDPNVSPVIPIHNRGRK